MNGYEKALRDHYVGKATTRPQQSVEHAEIVTDSRADDIIRGIENLRRDLRAAELRDETSAADAIRVRIEQLESELQKP